MLTLTAPVLLQASVEDWPAVMLGGVAVQPNNCGPDPPATVTVIEEVSSFTLLRAVKVYVVVCVGLTVIDPFTVTAPAPVMLAESALRVFQVRVTAWPALIWLGFAEKETIWARSAALVAIRTRAWPCPPWSS